MVDGTLNYDETIKYHFYNVKVKRRMYKEIGDKNSKEKIITKYKKLKYYKKFVETEWTISKN